MLMISRHSKIRFFSTMLIFGFMFMVLLVAPSFALPYGKAKYGSCTYNTCSITLSTSGTITLNVNPTASGVYTTQKDSINIQSGASTGYTVDLSASSSTTDLESGANKINRLSASFSSPATLSVNNWGYRIDDIGAFGIGPTSAITSAPSNSLKFAGIQPVSSADTILSTSSASAGGGDDYDIWYGVKADSTLPNGTYSQVVTYTAIQKF